MQETFIAENGITRELNFEDNGVLSSFMERITKTSKRLKAYSGSKSTQGEES